jgi:hypothetical protein
MVMGDSQWHGRIALGPLGGSDVVSDEPPDPNAAWGIEMRTVGGARATLGTTMPAHTKTATGIISLGDGRTSWGRVTQGEY